MKRGVSDYNFLLGIDKPSGMSSHDVVNRVRKILGEGRVGHMGTLDPLASGVMIVGVGSSTRLNKFLENHDKRYEVTGCFGIATNTYDSEGEIVERCVAPEILMDMAYAAKKVKGMQGPQSQTPPKFSAVKVNGKPAYKSAREGKNVELKPRQIEVYEAALTDVQRDGDCVLWNINLFVSKGTYIRSLIHDLGVALGVPAHVVELRRSAIGSVSINDCAKLDDLSPDSLPILDATKLLGFDKIWASSTQVEQASFGQNVMLDCDSNIVCLVDGVADDAIKLHAICRHVAGNQYKPELVFKKPLLCSANQLKGVKRDKTDSYNVEQMLVMLKGSVCTFGVFDGVHEGHQSLIRATIDDAKSQNKKSVIVTFDIDPDELFVDGFKKIMTNDTRIQALKDSGVDFVVVLNFNELKDMQPEQFLDTYFNNNDNTPTSIHVGSNFFFGKKGCGTVDTLKQWGVAHNMRVEVHQLLTKNGKVISSTNIRRSIM